MRVKTFGLIAILFFTPIIVSASSCDVNVTSVFYVNGIFTDKKVAERDLQKLELEFSSRGRSQNVDFYSAYNESHLAGAGDLAQSVLQAYGSSFGDYDLVNMLTKMHEDLTTRKVLLVGHSQGTFYTNAAYDYLVSHGVSAESIGVYNIATPADRVGGGGNYLTSSTDNAINTVVRELTRIGFARQPLPANIDIELPPNTPEGTFRGHGLSGVYLKQVPERIIGDIDTALASLKVGNDGAKECFNPPDITLGHRALGVTLAVADPTTKLAKSAAVNYYNTAYAIRENTYAAATTAASYVFSGAAYVIKNINLFGAALTASNNDTAKMPLESAPDDLSLINLDGEALDLATLLLNQNSPEDQDDLLERIDLLRAQIAKLTLAAPPKITQVVEKKIETIEGQDEDETPQPVITVNPNRTGISEVIYPTILISEVQTAGSSSATQEFVELYNPNTSEVDLTSWYLQRKTKGATSFSTYAANTLFSGKKIAAHGYLVIAREDSGFAADITVTNPLTDDNTLALKNPNGQISDKVGWGEAGDFETVAAQNPPAGQAIGRSGDEKDTDNNSKDFSLTTPTVRLQNVAYVSPVVLAVPNDTVAPTGEFLLTAKQTALAFTVNFSLTDTGGSAVASGIDGYTFRYKAGQGAWTEEVYTSVSGTPVTFSGERAITGSDETTYYFQVKTKDMAQNQSDWQPEIPASTKVSLDKKILINEIQIDSIDGSGGTGDDWVELYNPNDVVVDLSDWSIQKHSAAESCSIETSYFKKNFVAGNTIAAKGFFLVVNSGALQSLIDLADMTTSWSLSDNNTIYLVRSHTAVTSADDTTIVDHVGFGESCFPETSSAPAIPDAKSIVRKKIGQDTDSNVSDFKVSDEATPKGNFPKTRLTDATNYADNPNLSIPGGFWYDMLLRWQSSSSNIDYYQVQYKKAGGEWADWQAHATSLQESFQGAYSLLNDNVYYFRVRATDTDGNVGDWSDELVVDLTVPVIINEIGYAGTTASDQDQWIELYNRTGADIDLTGYKLTSGQNGNTILSVALSGTIPAHGYFVLEKTDDDTLSDIVANQIFTGSIGSQYMYLRAPNNRYIDEVATPGNMGDDGNASSIERVSQASFGIHSANWKLNNGTTINGIDRAQNPLQGTPGQQNSVGGQYTYIETSFAENTTLPKAFSPYLLKGLNTGVLRGGTLTVEPGTVIKFYDNQSKLNIAGTLLAQGSDTQNIIFTSLRDDEYGGDTNGDGVVSSPEAGNWLSLYFSSTSINSVLEYVRVRYGGAVLGSSPVGFGNAIWADKSSISLKNSIVEKNQNRGLRLTMSDSVVEATQFIGHNSSHQNFPTDEAKGVYIEGGSPQITNSYFEDNHTGIYAVSYYNSVSDTTSASTPTVQQTVFSKNWDPIYWGEGAFMTLGGNSVSENSTNGIIFWPTITQNITLVANVPYVIKTTLNVPQNIILTLESGVRILFYNTFSGLKIDGTLNAQGTSANPITFDSFDSQEANKWTGLRFTKNSVNSVLDNVRVSHGGAYLGNPQNQEFTAAVKVEQSVISLTNSVFDTNANNAVWLQNSASIIDSVQFINHQLATANQSAKAVYVNGGSPQIKNSIFQNNNYGIYGELFHNDATGEDIPATPVLENNTFEGSVTADVFP